MKDGLARYRLTGVLRGTGKGESLWSVEMDRSTDGSSLLLDGTLLEGLLSLKSLLDHNLLGRRLLGGGRFIGGFASGYLARSLG